MIKMIKTLAEKFFALLGFELKRLRRNPRPLWDEDPDFNALYAGIKDRTTLVKKRCFLLYEFASQARSVSGDVAEIGVYKGGTAKLLAGTFKGSDKAIHLFDTFSGMPPVDKKFDTYHKEGDFGDTSFENIKTYMSDCRDVSLHQGLFPVTAKPVENKRFSFVHVDVDIYRSVTDCCDFFYPRMERGGIMVFDDYGFLTCPGAKTAVDKFFEQKPEHPLYFETGQCVVIKL